MITPRVDVAICAYGKPVQTAVTLASLLRHSGHHISKIYFQNEGCPSHGWDPALALEPFHSHSIECYTPEWLVGWAFTAVERLADAGYRRSMRYQIAWEDTDKDFLFLTHNDCLYSADVIGDMLGRIEDGSYSGAGIVGQCWNCPANFARVCNGNTYEQYNPTFAEVEELLAAYPSPRTPVWSIDRDRPMPLPECRLNEFACLINIAKCRPEVMPLGSVLPIGCLTTDTGTDWFRQLVVRGHRFLNCDKGFRHAPFSPNMAGHASNTDAAAYLVSEQNAYAHLVAHYPEWVTASLTASLAAASSAPIEANA